MLSNLEQILNPRSIAIIGASENPTATGYSFMHHLLDFGFKGKIYPVNPKASSDILGWKAYPSIKDIPEPVDYVIYCAPASAVLDSLDQCAQNGVKGFHLYSGRFSETGRVEGKDLEQKLTQKLKETDIRLIGPNCMGLYNPGAGISFLIDLPREPGSAGFFSQSGGGAGFFIHNASLRAVRFSKAVSGGNALDLNESDFLDYFSQDPETRIILMYLEGTRDGRRFFNSLKHAASIKPVIILKGGKSESGSKAAASHTAALAGSVKIWESAVTQAGGICARNFDELTDLAVSFYNLPPVTGPRVGITGGGGGHSVLGADECEESGLKVVSIPNDMREELKNKNIPIWDWIGNPADVSILGGSQISTTDVLEMMSRNSNFDLLIAIINEHSPGGEDRIIGYHDEEVKGIIKVKNLTSKPLLAVVSDKSTSRDNHDYWRWVDLSTVRGKLLAANIPIYPTTTRAASAARKLMDYYQKRQRH